MPTQTVQHQRATWLEWVDVPPSLFADPELEEGEPPMIEEPDAADVVSALRATRSLMLLAEQKLTAATLRARVAPAQGNALADDYAACTRAYAAGCEYARSRGIDLGRMETDATTTDMTHDEAA